jgi:hypothetical protein
MPSPFCVRIQFTKKSIVQVNHEDRFDHQARKPQRRDPLQQSHNQAGGQRLGMTCSRVSARI